MSLPSPPRGRGPTSRAPILADRVRRIGEDGFAFLPNRFLRDGFFTSLGPDELRLYLLLILAGDRQGLSFYHYDRLCSLLELPIERYIEVRNALIQKDLIAFDGTRFQVLALPAQPRFDAQPALRTREDLERKDPATIRVALLDALARTEDDDEP